MYRSPEYNLTKKAVLESLSHGGWHTAKEIRSLLLSKLGISKDVVALRMALMRYYHQGLLKRKKKMRREFMYAISPRGIERLNWLINNTPNG